MAGKTPIDLQRNGQNFGSVNVDPEVETLLDLFTKLKGRSTEPKMNMQYSDKFQTKAGNEIEFREYADTKVSSILDGSFVKIKGQVEPVGPAKIQVVRSGTTTPVPAKVEDYLSEFRKQLNLAENERFQDKDTAGSSFSIESEKAFKIQDAITDSKIYIVPASRKRDITVKDGKSGSRSFPEQEESQTLHQFKQYLIKQNEMSASDIFVVGDAEVQDPQAATYKLGEAADKAADKVTISVKKGGPIWGEAPPVDGSKAPQLKDWTEKIDYGSPQYPTPAKFTGTAPTDLEHHWGDLSAEDKRYLFSTRLWAAAILFDNRDESCEDEGQPPANKETSGAKLRKAGSGYKAVMIKAEQPSVVQPDESAESSFHTTYSQMVHDLRKRGATSVSASVGAKGVAVKGGFSTSTTEFSQTDRTKIYLSQLIRLPVVELEFKDEHIAATVAFTDAITGAVNKTVTDDPNPDRVRYRAILDELNRYGHFIPKRFTLGGAYVIEEIKTIDKSATIDERTTSFSAGIGAAVHGVEAAVESGNTQEVSNKTTALLSNHSNNVKTIGGARTAFSNETASAWLTTLKNSRYWAIIDYVDLAPTIQYLPPGLLRQCLALIKAHWADPETEGRTVLNMLEYATLAESAWMKSQAARDDLHEIYGGPQL